MDAREQCDSLDQESPPGVEWRTLRCRPRAPCTLSHRTIPRLSPDLSLLPLLPAAASERAVLPVFQIASPQFGERSLSLSASPSSKGRSRDRARVCVLQQPTQQQRRASEARRRALTKSSHLFPSGLQQSLILPPPPDSLLLCPSERVA